jgi:SAM-dependent methyltransferase
VFEQRFAAISGGDQLLGYDVAICRTCGGVYADGVPDQAWFDDYYRRVSKYTDFERKGLESPADALRFDAIAALIESWVPDRTSSIVETGCATGGLLRRLKDRGYTRLLGQDKSTVAAEVARTRHAVEVTDLDLGQLAARHGTADLLIQIGILEHIRDVESAMAAVLAIVRPDGLTYIEVPDLEGFAEHPGAPYQQFSIEHINFFTRRSLEQLMARFGFRPEQVERTSRQHTDDGMMPVIWGIFRRGVSLYISTPGFDSGGEQALRRYIERSDKLEQTLIAPIGALAASGRKVLFWGVGTQTMRMLASGALTGVDIVAFVDSNPAFHGAYIDGRPVIAPQDIRPCDHPIVIGSQLYQREIKRQISDSLGIDNEIICLFPEDLRA